VARLISVRSAHAAHGFDAERADAVLDPRQTVAQDAR